MPPDLRVDTLTFGAPITENMLAMLKRRRVDEYEDELTGDVATEVRGGRFEMRIAEDRLPLRFATRRLPDGTIFFQFEGTTSTLLNRADNRLPLSAELTSDALQGIWGFIRDGLDWLPDWSEVRLRRIDLVADFQVGAQVRPVLAALARTPPSGRLEHTAHWKGDRITGISAGPRRPDWLVRLYDKDVEGRRHRPPRPAPGILRFEAQLRSGALTAAGLIGPPNFDPGDPDGAKNLIKVETLRARYFKLAQYHRQLPIGPPTAGDVYERLAACASSPSVAARAFALLLEQRAGRTLPMSPNTFRTVRRLLEQAQVAVHDLDGQGRELRRLDYDTGNVSPS